MIKPNEVQVTATCICPDTLGRLELEVMAACIVLYHWEHSPYEWIPITRNQLAKWLPTSSAIRAVAMNPFWKPDIVGFCDGGYIDGWNVPGAEGADIPGTLTEKFFAALEKRKVQDAEPRTAD